MEGINELTRALQGIIAAGAVARILWCLSLMFSDFDEEKTYKIRLRNVVVFCIIAETAVGLFGAIVKYYV